MVDLGPLGNSGVSVGNFAKLIPSRTEEGSPGPLEKKIPSGLLPKTSS